MADQAALASRSALGSLLLTQVTFSLTSIGLALLLGAHAAKPKPELALLTGVLLVQGLARIVVGVNLPVDAEECDGAMWLAVALAVLAGVPFVRLGPQWWLMAAVPTVTYEVLRSWTLRRGGARRNVDVAVADVAWFVPSLVLVVATSTLRAPVALLCGGLAASAFLCSRSGTPAFVSHALTARGTWLRRRRANVRRSLLEGTSGVLLPFACVALLSAFRRYDDTNALRAASQAMSPIGSLVGVTMFAWERLSTRLRHFAGHALVFAPVAVALVAAVVPRLLGTLSGHSPYVLAYAMGWSAFGVSQTRVALNNADHRHQLDSRLPNRGLVLLVAVALLVGALTSTVALAAVLTLTSVALFPWIGGMIVQRQLGSSATPGPESGAV